MWIVPILWSNRNSVDAVCRIRCTGRCHAWEKVLLEIGLIWLENMHGECAESHVPEESTDGALVVLQIGEIR